MNIQQLFGLDDKASKQTTINPAQNDDLNFLTVNRVADLDRVSTTR